MIRRYAGALCASIALAPLCAAFAVAQSSDDDAYTASDYSGLDASVDYSADYTADSGPVYGGESYIEPAGYDAGGYNDGLGRVVMGHGRLTTNDLLGDGSDRWQSGSVAASRVVGRGGWSGSLPDQPFDILEYRLGTQVMAPANLRRPEAGDRPWAGALSLGMHTHFSRGAVELSMGADLVVTGPQNGLSALQTALHDLLDVNAASNSVTDNQIENGFHPTAVIEAANSMPLGGQAVLRPFVEARGGVETMVRVGADLTLGSVGQGELMVRDTVSGQRYRAVTTPVPGFSYVLGGDLAYVDSSTYLPDNRGYDLTPTRNRLRAGMHWQGERNAAFYGVTWLSKEFEAQKSGQTVGSVRLDFQF